MNDIKPEICIHCLRGQQCNDENCNKIHLTDYQLTMSDVLQVDDLFYLKQFIDDKNQVSITEREQELMGELPSPILCTICKMPVADNASNYFKCCDVFTCTRCHEKWPFHNCCPSCGQECDQIDVPPEKIQDIRTHNTVFQKITLLEDG